MVGTGTEQLEALKRKLDRWVVVAPQEVKKALGLGAELVRREAQVHHFKKPKMPRGVGGILDAWLGTTKSWRLRNSIVYKVTAKSSGEYEAIVGTNIWYGRRHEYGLYGMPERPFLRPSLTKKRQDVFKMIEEAFFKSYGK